MLTRPLAPVGITLACGIAAAYYNPAVVFLLLGAAVIIIFLLLARYKKRSALALMLVFIAGFLRAIQYSNPGCSDISQYVDRRPPVISGIVISEPETRNDKVCFVISVSHALVSGKWIKCSGKVWTVYYNPNRHLPEYGNKLTARVSMHLPDDSGNPGQFSWKQHLARQGIYSTAAIYGSRSIRYYSFYNQGIFRSIASRTRNIMTSSIDAIFNKSSASIIEGVTLGTYAAVSDDMLSEFSRSGTLHLLAASGFNCGVLTLGLEFLFRKMGMRRSSRRPIIILFLIIYMLVVGLKPSIVRATTMSVLALLAVSFRRPADMINLVFAAAIAILYLKPSDLYDAGFQLSFAAVFGILLVLPVIERLAGIKTRRKKKEGAFRYVLSGAICSLLQAVSATTAAGLTTAPIMAQTFNQLSLVSLPANAAVAMAVLPVFTAGILSPVAVHVPMLRWCVYIVGASSASLVEHAVRFFGDKPGSVVSVRSPGLPGVIGYYLILALITNYASKRFQKT